MAGQGLHGHGEGDGQGIDTQSCCHGTTGGLQSGPLMQAESRSFFPLELID